jgi:hypothetical protein
MTARSGKKFFCFFSFKKRRGHSPQAREREESKVVCVLLRFKIIFAARCARVTSSRVERTALACVEFMQSCPLRTLERACGKIFAVLAAKRPLKTIEMRHIAPPL